MNKLNMLLWTVFSELINDINNFLSLKNIMNKLKIDSEQSLINNECNVFS